MSTNPEILQRRSPLNSPPRVVVVVPAYNEASRIGRTLRGIPSWVDGIVVVDDASTDGTLDVCAAVEDRRVTWIQHPENRGVGAAIATGYRHGLSEGADILVVMGADDQMNPSEIQILTDTLYEGAFDYVKGDRLSHPKAFQSMPLLRWLGNHALSWLTRRVLHMSVRDSQCGYTAIGRDAAARLLEHGFWHRYGYPNDILAWLHRHGMRWHEVIVQPIYNEKKSGVSLKDALWTIPKILLKHRVHRRYGLDV